MQAIGGFLKNIFTGPSVQVMTKTEVEGLIKSAGNATYVLLDVRNPNETASGMIPTAHNVPLGELSSALNLAPEAFQQKYHFDKSALEKADKVVFYCRSGARASTACGTAIASGLPEHKVFNYRGSALEWFGS
eukprot:Rmarinus@m.19187